jgi:serine/threonine-protein kinase CTR1
MISASQRKVIYKEIIINRKIGEGGFADVFRGIYKEQDVAIKVLRFKEGEESKDAALEAFSEFRREVWIMSSLDHPCLCRLVGFCIFPTCIVCEFVDKGDLYTFVHCTPEDPKYVEYGVLLRVRMALDIALGMRYLHNLDPPIIHRLD